MEIYRQVKSNGGGSGKFVADAATFAQDPPTQQQGQEPPKPAERRMARLERRIRIPIRIRICYNRITVR